MHADNSHHLKAAAAARSNAAAARALASLELLTHTGTAITFPAVAHHAGVSRAFVYANTQVRHAIETARVQTTSGGVPDPQVRTSDASLLARLQEAHHRVRDLRRENERLRAELAIALGQQRHARSLTATSDQDQGERAREPW